MKRNNNSGTSNNTSTGSGSLRTNSIVSSSLPASSFMNNMATGKKTSAVVDAPNSTGESGFNLAFERKDLTPKGSSPTQTDTATVQQPKRMKRKRNFILETALFWQLLQANKQYLTACQAAQKTICIPPDEEVDYVLNTLKYQAAKLQAFISKYFC